MKIAVIGGVGSTLVVVQKLSEYCFRDVIVFGYEPQDTGRVSGWVDLSLAAIEAGFTYKSFKKVDECEETLKSFSPDRVFAVGLSQIIPESMLRIPAEGFVGFHPTNLPLGRGRAPLAWLILEQNDGAASFFIMRQGVDDGPILVQVPFTVDFSDDAASVEEKMLRAEAIALDRLLPMLGEGSADATPQDHSSATYYGRRCPDDGLINWHHTVAKLTKHIRASCHPHPGAFTFDQDEKIVITSVKHADSQSLKGVVGRILEVADTGEFLVQCGDSCLWVLKWTASPEWIPRIGRKLGFYADCEIFKLRSQVSSLQRKIDQLESLIQKSSKQ